MKYTEKELDSAAISDLLSDARCSERQAANGPFYPEKGITKESCLAYAAECREKAARYQNGGAHDAVLKAI